MPSKIRGNDSKVCSCGKKVSILQMIAIADKKCQKKLYCPYCNAYHGELN